MSHDPRRAARAAALLAAAAALLATGCTDLSQRWELDHARVLAVRLSAPGLAAGEAATIDALVVDDAGAPAVMAPTAASLTAGPGAPPSASAPVTIAPAEAGWTVVAGDAAAIAAARVAAGLTDDQPLDVAFGAVFTIGDASFIATKRVRLGEALANPPAPTIRVDGAVAAGVVTIARDREIALTVDGVADDPSLEIAWLTGTGTLTYSQTTRATLEVAADDPAAGHVVVVVRSDTGGVAWATAEVAVD